jgi:hypothetical protein
MSSSKECREDNVDTMVRECRFHAEEVDGYIDVLDLLVDDEAYVTFIKLNVVGER